jgi:glycosyltransferase involved in cell wall biosynthesis
MDGPLVGIVIPVYNGADYLQECLTSILGQTYPNWRAVIVNNCSRDGTGAIADEFARRDARFRVVHCVEFLGQCENYNRAISLVPDGSAFIKVVEADNWIAPECLERMLEVAKGDERIGIVGAYYLKGLGLQGSGIPYNTNVLSGRQVCRMHLLEKVYFLGTPTTLLYRAAAVRELSPCFQPGLFYDDVDLCFRILRGRNFGFVHQVLAFLRVDNNGLNSVYLDFDSIPARQLLLAEHYGQFFLTPVELERLRATNERGYFRQLGRAVMSRKSHEYWEFHRHVFRLLGRNLRANELIWPAFLALADLAFNPKSSCEKLAKRVGTWTSQRSGRLRRVLPEPAAKPSSS